MITEVHTRARSKKHSPVPSISSLAFQQATKDDDKEKYERNFSVTKIRKRCEKKSVAGIFLFLISFILEQSNI